MTEYTAEKHQETFIEVSGNIRDLLWESVEFRYMASQLDKIRERNDHEMFDEFLDWMDTDTSDWVEGVTENVLQEAHWYNSWRSLRKIRAARAFRESLLVEKYAWRYAWTLKWSAERKR